MHYILEVSRYTNIVYIGVYLVPTYTERLFSTVCYFLSYFCRSFYFRLFLSQVSKFHNFFLTCSESETRCGFLVFSLMECSIPSFQYFFSFFHVVCKLLKSLFSHFLLVSKLHELSL